VNQSRTAPSNPSLSSPDGFAIDIRELHFSYRSGPEVLHIPSFRVTQGEHAFLYGPSGSGKTTLLGLVAGVLEVQDGAVSVLGQDLARISPAARDRFRSTHLGYIFQLFNLISYLSVEENIMLPCQVSAERRARLNGADLRKEARRLAEHLDLGPYLNRNVLELSVGQQQRVAAARAMIGRPALLIADEPTSALDHDHRGQFLDLLFEQCNAAGTTLLFVSHDQTLMPRFERQIALREVNLAAQRIS
jgi:putative ABC transport system ATP-binding protein